ncbi:hypothetical protein OG272_45295 [Streptomyces sp. NBC_00104]|uniref:hypothetical protein n=1 Tax=unclassified Streptomyces TaxID=2593676 RepID=UPI002E1E9C59
MPCGSDDLGGWERQDAELLAAVDTLPATSRLTAQQWAGPSARYGTNAVRNERGTERRGRSKR